MVGLHETSAKIGMGVGISVEVGRSVAVGQRVEVGLKVAVDLIIVGVGAITTLLQPARNNVIISKEI